MSYVGLLCMMLLLRSRGVVVKFAHLMVGCVVEIAAMTHAVHLCHVVAAAAAAGMSVCQRVFIDSVRLYFVLVLISSLLDEITTYHRRQCFVLTV